MSNILVQNIKHTNGTTAVEINTSAQMTVKSDGGATTTSLQQGLAKARCLFDQTAPEIDDSFNTSSLTDSAKGKGIINFTNNMGGALTYSCTMGTVNGNDNDPYCSALTANRAYVTQTTSAFPFRSGYSGHQEGSGNSPYADFFDPNGALVVAHGDLA